MAGAIDDRSRWAQGAAASPWIGNDAMRWGVLNLLAAAAIAFSWYLAAGEADPADQLRPLAISIAGAVASFLGNVGWLLRGRSIVGGRMALLLGEAPADVAETGNMATGSTVGLVWVEGRGLLHRSDCTLTAGRSSVRPATPASTLRPCPICRPAVSDDA